MKRTAATARKSKSKARIANTKPRRKPIWRWKQGSGLVFAMLVAVVFACYANSLGNGFVFDDEFLVPTYGRLQSFSKLVQGLFDSYRPVRNASYVIDFVIWGSNPFGFHLTNVLIHAGNSVLVFVLIRRLTEKWNTAVIAALIFAVHPIQTDSVSYVSGRRDVLFALFYLSAFLAYLSYRAKGSRTWFVIFLGLWGLSLMSKEMAVSLPLVIFAWNLCDAWGEDAGSWLQRFVEATKRAFLRDKWLYTLLAVASFGFALYSIFFLRASGRAGQSGVEYWGGSLYATVLTVVRVHTWYLKQLVYPTPIAQYFGAFDISTSLLDWRVILALVVLASVLFAGAVLLVRDRLMAFAVFSYFAALAPVSQIIPHHELLADHYLYLPMLSFSMLVALVVNRISQRGSQARIIAYGVVGVVIVAFGAMTVSRNRDWKNELSVWEANYKAVPNSPRASYNLGGLYMIKDPDRAETLLKESIASDPTFEPSYLTLARLYVSRKRIPEAEGLIQQGLDLIGTKNRSFIIRNPSLLRSQFTTTLAAAKWEEGDPKATEQLLSEAVEIYPWHTSPYEALANIYHNSDPAKENEVLTKAVRANPSTFEVRARLAALAVETEKYDEAQSTLQEMLGLSPVGNACLKARPYLSAVKSGVPNSMELKPLTDTLDLVLRQCVSQ